MQQRAVYGLLFRHQLATRVIEGSAARYAKSTTAVGALRTIAPAGGVLGMISSLVMRAPEVYQPMVRDLAVIYNVSRLALREAVIYADEHAAQVGTQLAAEFSKDAVQSMAKDMAPSLTSSMAGRLIPGVGGIMSTFDTSLAATLTWRVGAMAVLYLLNNNAWVGSKADTDNLARQLVGAPGRQIEGRVQLQAIPYQVHQVYWTLVAGLVQDIQRQRALNPALTRDQVRDLLRGAEVVDDQIEAALARC